VHRRLVLPVVLLAAALAACSAPEPTGASGAAPATQLAEPDHTVLSANSTAKLGTVVIDGLGWTLYRFDADSATPPRSACTGSCAEQWPPVLMQAGTPAYEGVDPSVVGTVARDDGRQQVTIGGWPVYRHASDSQPGAVDGQGAQGQWFAVTPSGGKASPQS
jgi:predicted lipoprotein with Yx(FWY)xxD motif